jgi:CheY-like chemotaxis protein
MAANAYTQFRALIVDPNPATRSYLWEAVLADPHFKNVTAAKALEDARGMFQDGYSTDVVLISSTFDAPKISRFVEGIRETEGGKECAIISVMRGAHQENSNLGMLLAEGADGFLLTPFSVFSVGQVAQIAKSVKREHDRRRKLAASQLLSIDLLGMFDALNKKLFLSSSIEGKVKTSMKALQNKIREIIAGEPDLGREAVVNALKSFEPPKDTLYQGPSQRVKKKLASKD